VVVGQEVTSRFFDFGVVGRCWGDANTLLY